MSPRRGRPPDIAWVGCGPERHVDSQLQYPRAPRCPRFEFPRRSGVDKGCLGRNRIKSHFLLVYHDMAVHHSIRPDVPQDEAERDGNSQAAREDPVDAVTDVGTG